MNQVTSPYFMAPGQRLAPQPASLFAEGGMGTTYLTLIAMVSAITVYGKITDFFGPIGEDLRSAVIFFTVAMSMVAAAICLWRGMISAAFCSIAGLAWIFIYTFIYSINSGVPFTFAAGGEYFGYSFVGLFALVIRDKKFEHLMRLFFFVCLAYACFYIIVSIGVQVGAVSPGSATRAIVGADDAGRGDRIFATAMPLVFGLMYCLSRLIEQFSIRFMVISMLFLISLYLTASRGISLTVIGVFLAFIIIRSAPKVSKISLIIAFAGMMFSLYLIENPDLNPFYLAIDTSGLIRILSVNVVADLFYDYWVFGTGIAYGVEGYYPITGVLFFVPGDIGYIGMIFSYGIFGFLIYLSLIYLSCTSHNRLIERGYSKVLADSIALTSCVFALYGLQSPQFDSGSSASLLAMACLGLAIDRRRVHRGHRGTAQIKLQGVSK